MVAPRWRHQPGDVTLRPIHHRDNSSAHSAISNFRLLNKRHIELPIIEPKQFLETQQEWSRRSRRAVARTQAYGSSLLPLLAHCYKPVARNCLPNHCRRAGAATGQKPPQTGICSVGHPLWRGRRRVMEDSAVGRWEPSALRGHTRSSWRTQADTVVRGRGGGCLTSGGAISRLPNLALPLNISWPRSCVLQFKVTTAPGG